MADIIHLLSDAVANQIAAGEVIQRPASVVKELVENAIDAGASKIQVHIKDAGRTLIQVTDNGGGMSPTDARMAFERHATSKIQSAEDLFSIHTMGFRGEALASIASVADVELRSKRKDDELGTKIHIVGSKFQVQEATSAMNGTTFWVKNLFFNVPARRKFLKSNTAELKHIINEIQRVALSNYSIAFSLYHNNAVVYDLPPANFRKRIVNIFGNNMNQSLVPINTETSLVKINGFIGQPKYARKKFGEQFFFVNGRFMRHPFFHKGVMQAYEKILPREMIPAYFIAFEVDASSIDINIHPTKTEIKFEHESAIWQLLHAAVREGLGKFNVSPSIDFDQSGSFDIPIAPKSTEGLRAPEIEVDHEYNPFEQKSVSLRSRGFGDDFDNDQRSSWEKLYKEPEETGFFPEPAAPVQSQMHASGEANSVDRGRNYLTFKNKYILLPVKSGLMVIDQKRAHERILFEQFMITLTNEDSVGQQLLFPQTIEVDTADSVLLRDLLEDLNKTGFDVREFGNDTFIINGVPGFLGDTDVKHLIESMLEDLKGNAVDVKEQMREKMAVSLATASAIASGQQLSQEEAGSLIDGLFACHTPNFSPKGKPVIEIIPFGEIEKRFK